MLHARTRLTVLAAVFCVVLTAGQALAVTETDMVFVIDATGSMNDNIAAVKSGLTGFINGLNTAEVDARFALVLYGGAPELVLDFTSNGTDLTTAFNSISTSGAVAGFQFNHNVNPEAGLEAIRIALGGAADNTLLRDNVGGSGGLTYRTTARKNLILVTDEDSDLPFYTANRFAGQSGTEPPGTLGGGWDLERDATADVAIDEDVFLNILMNRDDAPSRLQYGDPALDVSDADFLNFNPSATLANLQAAGYGASLEARLLAAGLVARTFDIAQVNQTAFIDNFFAAKIEETINPSVIPEPSVALAFGMGMVSLAGYLRRRRAA